MSSSGWKFGWKRKAGAKVSQRASAAFEQNNVDDDELENGDIDWLSATKSRRIVCLEDAITKSNRLKDEGSLLAESERYWEALKKWDEAIQFTPLDEKLFEMKAQALMMLSEVFPALSAARKVVEINPRWWVSYQTLGRAELNVGEVRLAIRSFSKAIHLHPVDSELWEDDLKWACSLLNRKSKAEQAANNTETGLTITEIQNSSVCDTESNQTTSLELFKSENDEKQTANDIGHGKKVKHIPTNYVLMRD